MGFQAISERTNWVPKLSVYWLLQRKIQDESGFTSYLIKNRYKKSYLIKKKMGSS